MMRVVFGAVCLMLLSGSHSSPVQFQCDTLLPTRPDAEAQDEHSYPVFTHVSKNSYTPSEEIEVTLTIRGNNDIRYFIAQMHLATTNEPRGTWLVNDPIARTHRCHLEADTLINAGSETLTNLRVVWVAPHHPSSSGKEDVELMVTVMTESGEYWTTERPILLREETSESAAAAEEDKEDPVNVEEEEQPAPNQEEAELPNDTENPDDEGSDAAQQDQESVARDRDDHGLSLEINMVKLREEQNAREVADEDRASEGDWSVIQEEERKAREEELAREMYDFEKNKAAEEEARQARIRSEMKDKEEWEAQQAKLNPTTKPTTQAPRTVKPVIDKNENELDFNRPVSDGSKGNGAKTVTATLLAILSGLLLTLL